MKLALSALVLALGPALASAQVSPEDHSVHHPPDASASTPARSSAAALPVAGDAFAEQMTRMREMHARMQQAKTPRERRALMDDQMKLMQAGMDMMRSMGAGMMGGGMPGAGTTAVAGASGAQSTPATPPSGQAGPMPGMGSSGMGGMSGMMNMHGMMERRIAMMEMMMQMIIDREAAASRR